MYITGTKRCPRARCNDFRKRKIRYHLLLMNGADARIEEHPKFLVKLKTLLNQEDRFYLTVPINLYVWWRCRWREVDPLHTITAKLFSTLRTKAKKKTFWLDVYWLQHAPKCGFRQWSELILEGEHYDYLAKLSLYEKKIILTNN
jgi:hypothetical protein